MHSFWNFPNVAVIETDLVKVTRALACFELEDN